MAANRKDLKSWVRIDGTGRVVSGSNILAKKAPKVGNWRRVVGYECCEPDPVTPTCATYSYSQGDISALLSYTNCDGTPVGPFGMNGPIEDTFCCLLGTASVDVERGVTIAFVSYGCSEVL